MPCHNHGFQIRPLVYNNIAPKKQRCYPGNRTPDLPITRWLFCPFKLSSLFFDFDIISYARFKPTHPPIVLPYRCFSIEIIITFLFLLNALTAELRRPSSRRRESNSRPITKQEGIAVTLRRASSPNVEFGLVPLHQLWSSASFLAFCRDFS